MTEPLPIGSSTRGAAAQIVAPLDPDPLADVEYTGDLEADSGAELDALQSAFRDRRRR